MLDGMVLKSQTKKQINFHLMSCNNSVTKVLDSCLHGIISKGLAISVHVTCTLCITPLKKAWNLKPSSILLISLKMLIYGSGNIL